MKQYINNIWAGGIVLLLSMAACSSSDDIQKQSENDVMTFEVLHPVQNAQSRLADAGFETEDQIGFADDHALPVYDNSILFT